MAPPKQKREMRIPWHLCDFVWFCAILKFILRGFVRFCCEILRYCGLVCTIFCDFVCFRVISYDVCFAVVSCYPVVILLWFCVCFPRDFVWFRRDFVGIMCDFCAMLCDFVRFCAVGGVFFYCLEFDSKRDKDISQVTCQPLLFPQIVCRRLSNTWHCLHPWNPQLY